jgi:putative NADH-flavin reductase
MPLVKLLVLGAAGKTGRLVVERALEAGHEVTAFARDPSRLGLPDEHLRVANGDARFAGDLSAALRGNQAVINTVGGGERRLIAMTATALVEAMAKESVKRLVTVSTFLATPNFRPTGTMRLFPGLVRGMAADDVAGAKTIEGSQLDWTIVYATLLKNGPAAGYRFVGLDEKVTGKNHLNRADLAECLLDVLADKSTIRQSLLVTSA